MIVWRYTFLIVSLLCLYSSKSRAEVVVAADIPDHGQTLSDSLVIYEDKSQLLSLEEVERLEDSSFQSLSGKPQNFGFTPSVFWARIDLQHPLVRQTFWIEYGYPMADYVDFYSRTGNGTWQQLHSGDRRSTLERGLRYRLPAFPIQLGPDPTRLYIRIQTSGMAQMPITLYGEGPFQEKRVLETAIFSLLYGGMIAVLLYNIFLFLSSLKPLVATYIGFLFFSVLSYAGQQGLWNTVFHGWDSSFFNNELAMGSGGFMGALSLTFSAGFLRIQEKLPRLYRVYQTLIALLLLQAVLGFIHYNTSARFSTVTFVPSLFLVVGSALLLARRGDRSARFYALAWLPYGLAALYFILCIFKILPTTVYTQFSTTIGAVFENILLSFAIGYQMRSEITEALRENKRINKELVEKEKARTLFFHNTSHELRTPLNGIIGFLNLVLENRYGTVTDAVRNQLEKSIRLAESLKNQVNLILDLAKSKRGELVLRRQLISLPNLVKDAQNLAEGLMHKSKDADFRLNVILQEDTPFISDREKLGTILRNLLGNAFKFANPQRTNHVSLQVRQEGDHLTFVVKDTGIGIPREAFDKIFEDFTQVQGDARRAYEGTGLGLAMVRDLVKQMHGTVSVDSIEDQGSTFTVSIPSEKEVDSLITPEHSVEADPLPVMEGHSALSLVQDHTHQELQPGSILIIDDNETNCEVISEMLKSDFEDVRFAPGGRLGLEAIQASRPDLILLDLMMPDVSGEDVLKALKNDEEWREIPVVLITARASDEDRLQGLSLGADDYLAKPIFAPELRVRVRNMLYRTELGKLARKFEDQDKLAQLGELFRDLSHEVKNILHGSSILVKLDEADVVTTLTPFSFDSQSIGVLARYLLNPQRTGEQWKRSSLLELPQTDAALTHAYSSLRLHIASLELSDQEVKYLWSQLLTRETDEVMYLSLLLNILVQHQNFFFSLQRVQKLTGSVLSYTRSSSETTSTDFQVILQEVCMMLSTRFHQGGITFESSLLPLQVQVFPDRLRQIVLNLLGNAQEAVRDLPPQERWIRVSMSENGEQVELRFSNGGDRLPASVVEKLFVRGFTTKGEKGTGIGLHVSRRLAREMEGELAFEPLAQHPCFLLTLPVAKAETVLLEPRHQKAI